MFYTSLSPASKRRLSASSVAKNLQAMKVQKTAFDKSNIHKSNVPVEMRSDEVASAMERLKEGGRVEYKSDPKGAVRKTILKPSWLNPGQYELAFPAKKSARQSERLKSKRERGSSLPDFEWERI